MLRLSREECMTAFQRVREWMRKFGQAAPTAPQVPAIEEVKLRYDLIEEESLETLKALALMRGYFSKGMPVPPEIMTQVAKELADLIIVALGTFAAFGIDGDRAVELVIENNDLKLDHGLFKQMAGQGMKYGSGFSPEELQSARESLKTQVHTRLQELFVLTNPPTSSIV